MAVGNDYYPCPCCGFLVFDEEPGSYDNCPVCNWEDDAVQLRHPIMAGGANRHSLWQEQQRILRQYPMAVQEMKGYRRDPTWRPLTPQELVGEGTPQTGLEYFHAAGTESPGYYWRRDRGEPSYPTFRTLDARQGVFPAEPLPREWPLEIWLATLYDTPLEAFTTFDLARSLRQDIHREAVLPYCLRTLEQDPLAGELYDGELLTAVMKLPHDFWLAYPQERDRVFRLAEAAHRETDDVELQANIQVWITIHQRDSP